MIPYDLPAYFMLPWLFLHGAVIGSFLTVCIHRLPQHSSVFAAWRSLVHNPSHCDCCQKKLLARDNVPIFGWLLLGGRCRFCKTKIPAKYPLMELANGLLFMLVYVMEVPLNHWTPLSTSSLSCDLSPATLTNVWGLSPVAVINGRYLYHLLLVEALFVASLIDWELTTIPDSVTVPALIAGVSGAAICGNFWLVPVWFQDAAIARLTFSWLPAGWRPEWLAVSTPAWIATHRHWHSLAVSVAGLTVAGGIAWLVRVLGQLALRREAMGFGDVMLMAVIGSFIGWQPAIVVFFMAPILTLLASVALRRCQRGREIPYGPALSVATLAVLLGWRWIWPCVEWYFSLGLLFVVIATAMLLTIALALALRSQVVRCVLILRKLPKSNVRQFDYKNC